MRPVCSSFCKFASLKHFYFILFARKKTTQDASFRPLHPIDAAEGSVDGMPVKAQFSSDQQWTRALKYLLTNLKWLIAKLDPEPIK